MEEISNMDKMYKELMELKKDVHFIKSYMFDEPGILTEQEEAQLEEALIEHKQKKTVSMEDLKEELGD